MTTIPTPEQAAESAEWSRRVALAEAKEWLRTRVARAMNKGNSQLRPEVFHTKKNASWDYRGDVQKEAIQSVADEILAAGWAVDIGGTNIFHDQFSLRWHRYVLVPAAQEKKKGWFSWIR